MGVKSTEKPYKIYVYLCTPKPRAEGSNPSAPAICEKPANPYKHWGCGLLLCLKYSEESCTNWCDFSLFCAFVLVKVLVRISSKKSGELLILRLQDNGSFCQHSFSCIFVKMCVNRKCCFDVAMSHLFFCCQHVNPGFIHDCTKCMAQTMRRKRFDCHDISLGIEFIPFVYRFAICQV